MKPPRLMTRKCHFISVSLGVLLSCVLSTGCSNRKQPAPVSELYQGKTFRDFEQQAYSAQSYQVKAGDTLYSIAWYSGKDYRDLAKINNIAAPYQIRPGQTLRLIKLPKTIAPATKKKTGQTSKIIVNQSVKAGKIVKKDENVTQDSRKVKYRVQAIEGRRDDRWLSQDETQ